MSDSLVGKQLNNFYIEHLLGRGGMASVYYGMDIGLNRPVAIKVIDERYRNDEPLTERFISEAQTIATWRHDNIIQVYYAGNEGDIYYFVMEFIDGDDLTQYMETFHEQQKHIEYDEVMRILHAVANGLDYAHNKGVIHRDIKPSNIMISNDNRVVLMDFGLALDIQKGTIGESFGTPHYIAPEQARDPATAVAQSDQYALGVIAYEMLTGQVPFDNPSAMTVALMHINDQPPKPSDINATLTQNVENVLLKVLSKDPGDRFPTCQSFVESLEHAIAGRPTLIDDIKPTQLGEILITPRPESDRKTLNRPPNRSSGNTTQKSQQSNQSSRLPITLIAVVIVIIGIVAVLIAIGGGATSNPDETPVINAQLVDDVTETPIPTDTAIPATDRPTNTTVPSTATDQPTDTSVPPTTTEIPTDTVIPATDRPTNTAIPPTEMDIIVPPSPSDIPADTFTPVPALPTLAYLDGSQIVIYYNANSLYVWNPNSRRVRAGRFKFEAIDPEGNTLGNTFDGTSWTQFYSFVDGGNCVAIEMTVGTLLKPEECGALNAIVNSTPSGDIVFWTAQGLTAGFRVLWDDAEIARCDIAEESCTFNIPTP